MLRMSRISGITRKLAAALLALVLAVGMLPMAAQAADLPDWYFLFAIFKNVDADCTDTDGVTTHAKYTMTQDEIDLIRETAGSFEKFMNQVGVMRAHVDIMELNTTVTALGDSVYGSWIDPEHAAPLLKGKVNLDQYDHVFCATSLNVETGYGGLTGGALENGTGETCVNIVNRKEALSRYVPAYMEAVYVHEFLHFMETLSKRWGKEFDLHEIGDRFYSNDDYYMSGYTDIILNRVNGSAGLGTGVSPLAWQCPPHEFRTMREFTIPKGAASVGHDAFLNCTNLESVTIPNSVTTIDVSAFHGCSNLKSIAIPGSVTSIGGWAFAHCASLESVTIPSSVASIGGVAFYGCGSLKDVYYGGSESQWKQISIDNENNWNAPLLNAAVHYNSTMSNAPNASDTSNTPGTPNTPSVPVFTDVSPNSAFAPAISWAVEKGITTGKTAATFAPGENCSNGQILTFLWRANGSPEPTIGNPFRDTIPNSFQKAAVWAYEKGLVTGGTFGSGTPCTRAMAVTYLWKLAGSPATSGSANFPDVVSGAAYAPAVTWAVEKGITTGKTDGTFAPNEVCTRGQIVTFLYRDLA